MDLLATLVAQGIISQDQADEQRSKLLHEGKVQAYCNFLNVDTFLTESRLFTNNELLAIYSNSRKVIHRRLNRRAYLLEANINDRLLRTLKKKLLEHQFEFISNIDFVNYHSCTYRRRSEIKT